MAIVQLADLRSIDTDKLPAGFTLRYGRVFRPGVTRIQIELWAFLHGWEAPFGLGKLSHFKRLVKTFWPDFQWNRWTEVMARALCENDLAAFMGCGGSGKSHLLALWVLCNWWAAPQDTSVAVTSTDIEGAKRRVWGAVISAHQSARWTDDQGNKIEPPGKLTDQPAMIRLEEKKDGLRGAGQQAITLVPAGNENLNSALKILQGLHNKIVILVLDELQDLASSVIGGTLLENLSRNPRFQICAAGNIGSPDDPLGTICRPVLPPGRGYDDVDVTVRSWPIRSVSGQNGVCVRLDALDSPNFDDYDPAVGDKYKFLPGVEAVRQKEKEVEAGTIELGDWFRQWRAFITPRNVEDGRWSAAAILKFKGYDDALWVTPGAYITAAGCDPAYTSGGDRFMLTTVRYGQTNGGNWVIAYASSEAMQHDANVSELRNFALARQTIKQLSDVVTPEYFAIDISGENPLGDIFAEEWESNEFLRVSFSGKASDLPVSMTDRRPCHEEYGNRCSEMWCTGAKFLQAEQLRNLPKDLAAELSARKIRRGTGNKLFVESKKEMKMRTKSSPDGADSFNLAIEVLRNRAGAIAGSVSITQIKSDWNAVAKKLQVNPMRLVSAVGISHVGRGARRFR